MTNEKTKEFLNDFICYCQYGNSPFDCDYAKCEFGIAIRTLCANVDAAYERGKKEADNEQ